MINEINVTAFIDADTTQVLGSVAQLGDDAGTITWNNALNEARRFRYITKVNARAFAGYVREFGAWTDAEILAWTPHEANALFLQIVRSDWEQGQLERGEDGQVWFYLEG